MTLKQVSTKQWVKQVEKKLPLGPQALRVINQQLWCCLRGSGIMLLDGELQWQRNVPVGGASKVYDVAKMSNGDVITAASNGLYHSSNGQWHYEFIDP